MCVPVCTKLTCQLSLYTAENFSCDTYRGKHSHTPQPKHMDPMTWKLLRHYWPFYDDVIKWKHFPRYWPFVRGIHRSPVNSHHKGQWRRALIFSLICAWINSLKAGDLRRHHVHYDVTVMFLIRIYLQPVNSSYKEPVMERLWVVFCFKPLSR